MIAKSSGDESAKMQEWHQVSSSYTGLGIDLVYIKDMEGLQDGAVDCWLSEDEWKEIQESTLDGFNRITKLAGRFAAKEAVLKMLGAGLDQIELTHIEIRSNALGKPIVRLRGTAWEAWLTSGWGELEISITHQREYAVAAALGIRR
ncbi:Holo-[acyl-carrier-protein] synthase [compost metagenome]